MLHTLTMSFILPSHFLYMLVKVLKPSCKTITKIQTVAVTQLPSHGPVVHSLKGQFKTTRHQSTTLKWWWV